MKKTGKAFWFGASAIAAALAFSPAVFAQGMNNSSGGSATASDNGGAAHSSSGAWSNNGSGASADSNMSSSAAPSTGMSGRDARMKHEAEAALSRDSRTRNANIDVTAANGTIILSGHVKSKAAAKDARRDVAQATGVQMRNVKNHLTWGKSYSSEYSGTNAARNDWQTPRQGR